MATETIANGQTGSSVKPKINWNNGIGTYTVSPETPGIVIDQNSGILSWDGTLAPGNHDLRVTASNSGGTTSTTFFIINSIGTSTTEFTLIVNGPNINKEDRFQLYQKYPNPASAITYFVYNLTQKGKVSIDILDINGKTIKTIMSKQVQGVGRYSIQLNVEAMPSNLYFMRLYSNTEGARTIKFVVEK